VLLVERSGAAHIPGCGIKAVDTTAAGDCLAGAFAVALVEGLPLPNAAPFANQAAALSTTKPGAQTSLPSRADLERFVQAGHCL
jgi:ribokinase